MRIDQVITLTVKGDAQQARDAARRHGFDAVRVRARHLFEDATCTVLEANHSHAAVGLACEWFCEPEVTIPGYGQADGTLLFYQHEG